VLRALIALLFGVTLVSCAPGPKMKNKSTDSARESVPVLQERTPVLTGTWRKESADFTFAILGDKTGGDSTGWPVFDRAVDEINLLSPDFVVMVGDMIHGYTEDTASVAAEWDEFNGHAVRLKRPLFVYPGNHDVSTPTMLTWWRKHRGRTYYSFDYRRVHFLMLNTDEVRHGGTGNLGEEQVRFAVDDIQRSRDARHTFVFVHKPTWIEPQYKAEWKQITDALGTRIYTVIAGHWHRYIRGTREGHRHLIHGPTGAGMRPSEVKELGSFHHYSLVTMVGDSAHITLVEPGNIHPDTIATEKFMRGIMGFRSPRPVMPVFDGDSVRAGVAIGGRNTLPGEISLSASLLTEGTNWHSGADECKLVVKNGTTVRDTLWFTAHRDSMIPLPRLRSIASYDGKTAWDMVRPVSLFPRSAFKQPTEWNIAGPVPSIPPPDTASDDPPTLTRDLRFTTSPGFGWNGGLPVSVGGAEYAWRTIKSVRDLTATFTTIENMAAYAICGINSPDARTVYARFYTDDHGQVVVNGRVSTAYGVYERPEFIQLDLRAGWNTVVVKTSNGGGGWGFSLRIADLNKELRFAPNPQ
jgi:calcineurin-like phosphoesterase family protein